MKLSIAIAALLAFGAEVSAQSAKQDHYLVGLLNYPNSFIPEVLKNHTSGTYIPEGDENFPKVPFTDVPGVGFSDMEFYYDENGEKVLGQYYCLSDNGTFTKERDVCFFRKKSSHVSQTIKYHNILASNLFMTIGMRTIPAMRIYQV